jgi:hypothetical protein
MSRQGTHKQRRTLTHRAHAVTMPRRSSDAISLGLAARPPAPSRRLRSALRRARQRHTARGSGASGRRRCGGGPCRRGGEHGVAWVARPPACPSLPAGGGRGSCTPASPARRRVRHAGTLPGSRAHRPRARRWGARRAGASAGGSRARRAIVRRPRDDEAAPRRGLGRPPPRQSWSPRSRAGHGCAAGRRGGPAAAHHRARPRRRCEFEVGEHANTRGQRIAEPAKVADVHRSDVAP